MLDKLDKHLSRNHFLLHVLREMMITRELTWEDSQLILCIPWKFRNATDSEPDSLSTHTF